MQLSYKSYLTNEGRQQSFNDAAIIVSQAFPRRDSNIAQLYLMWEKCARYLQHVLHLKDCFREERKGNPTFTAPKTYCDLNNQCQRYLYPSPCLLVLKSDRYLLEINAYEDLNDLIEVNRMALESLPLIDQAIGLQGSLTSHTGQLLIRLGNPAEGVKWLKKSYEIRSHDHPFNPRESAWAAENAGNGIATLNDFPEAIVWLKRARDHWLEWSCKQEVGTGEWPACIKKSMGLAFAWAGELHEARKISLSALEQIESTQPYNWAMAA